jgi:hypothetical protein
VAAPEVQGVSFTGEEDLPSPAVIWGLLVLTIVVGSVVARARKSRR